MTDRRANRTTPPPPRHWLAVYTTMLGKPKYRRLSIVARAALFQVWLLAPAQVPEATWSNRADLVDLLELDRYPDPDALVDELIALRWLDLEDDGKVSVHDWDEHQFSASKAIRDYWEADRMREWRRDAKRTVPPAPPSTEQDKGSETSTGTETDTASATRTNLSEHRTNGPAPADPVAMPTVTVTPSQEAGCLDCGEPFDFEHDADTRTPYGWVNSRCRDARRAGAAPVRAAS